MRYNNTFVYQHYFQTLMSRRLKTRLYCTPCIMYYLQYTYRTERLNLSVTLRWRKTARELLFQGVCVCGMRCTCLRKINCKCSIVSLNSYEEYSNVVTCSIPSSLANSRDFGPSCIQICSKEHAH